MNSDSNATEQDRIRIRGELTKERKMLDIDIQGKAALRAALLMLGTVMAIFAGYKVQQRSNDKASTAAAPLQKLQ